MRALHLIKSLGNGGCENFLLRSLPELSKQGIDNLVVTLSDKGALSGAMAATGVPVLSLKEYSGLFWPALKRTILSQKPDVITTYLAHADIVGSLLRWRMRTPVVPFWRSTYNSPRFRIARWYNALSQIWFPVVLCNSEAVKNFFVSNYHVPSDKICVIPLGLDTQMFKPPTAFETMKLRKKYGLYANDIAIINVANFHPTKNHIALAKAYKLVHAKSSRIKLLLVGEGQTLPAVKRVLADETRDNAVKFFNHQNSIRELLSVADIFVIASTFEGMSNALLEAMSVGLPAAASDIPENHTLISENETGIFFNPHNQHDIARALLKLATDTAAAKTMGSKARLETIQHYDTHIICRQWAEFYRQFPVGS